MRRLAHIACAATVFVAAGAVPVQADPIDITIVSGQLVVGQGPALGSLNLVGTHGFTLNSAVAPSAGLQGPFAQCSTADCTPGSSIGLDVSFTGQSLLLPGVVMTIEGDRYDDLVSASATANIELIFSGSVTAPRLGPSEVEVSAPFLLTGNASALNPFGDFAHNAVLHGSGAATLVLVPYPTIGDFPPSWAVKTLTFDISQPTPEPSTLVLLGSGALALCRRRRAGSLN
jgi:hypothetical protein